MSKSYPIVGLGIVVVNKQGLILIGKRLGKHAPYYSIPGGHLEPGESFEQGAVRELKEETGLTISSPKVIAITNNLKTFRKEGLHTISVILVSAQFQGKIQNLEPNKCAELLWCDPHKLPKPHYEGSYLAIRAYLDNKFYVQT